MTDIDKNLHCTNTTCQFSETGKCVEGNEINECPHLQQSEPDSESTEQISDEAEKKKLSFIKLGGSTHLTLSEASSLMKNEYVPLVSFLGPAEAGKTSLIAEVYDAFQYGQYDALKFAGSRSLTAFEEISHAARAAARTEIPSPARTEIKDNPSLFHLRIASADSRTSILLADRSGEVYRQVADTPKIAADLIELRRANVINVLVDGEKLCDPSNRTSVMSQCTQTVQSLVLGGNLSRGTKMNLVLTKLDSVDENENRLRAHSDFESLPEKIASQCSNKIATVEIFKIAACPHNVNIEKGLGVEKLVLSWLTSKPLEGVFQDKVTTEPTRNVERTKCSIKVLQ